MFSFFVCFFFVEKSALSGAMLVWEDVLSDMCPAKNQISLSIHTVWSVLTGCLLGRRGSKVLSGGRESFRLHTCTGWSEYFTGPHVWSTLFLVVAYIMISGDSDQTIWVHRLAWDKFCVGKFLFCLFLPSDRPILKLYLCNTICTWYCWFWNLNCNFIVCH